MAESKSDQFRSNIKAHSAFLGGFASWNVKSLGLAVRMEAGPSVPGPTYGSHFIKAAGRHPLNTQQQRKSRHRRVSPLGQFRTQALQHVWREVRLLPQV